MSRYDILLQQQAPTLPTTIEADEPDAPMTPEPVVTETTPPAPSRAPQSLDQSTGESTDEPMGVSAEGSTQRQRPRSISSEVDLGATETVGRPKAFYITKRLNQRIDQAVRYYQEIWGIPKVDRSALVNALLDADEHWTDAALDQRVDRLIQLLTSRLTG